MNKQQRKRLVKLFRQGLFRADMLVPGAKVLIQHYRVNETDHHPNPISFRFRKSGPQKVRWIPATKNGETICLIVLPEPYQLDPAMRGDITIRGEARCHSELDGYNRQVGAHTAFGRAMKDLQKMENDDLVYLEVTDENINRIVKETRDAKQRRDLENSVGWLRDQVAILRKKLSSAEEQIALLEHQVEENWDD